MNKLILLIAGLLGLGASVSYEHLDFRPEISTGIDKTVITGDETPVDTADRRHDSAEHRDRPAAPPQSPNTPPLYAVR